MTDEPTTSMHPVLILVAGLLITLAGAVWTVRFTGHVGDFLGTRYGGTAGVLVFETCERAAPPECTGRFRTDDGSFERDGVTVEVREIPDPSAEVVPAHLQRGDGYGYADNVSIGLHVFLLMVRLVVLGAGIWILWLGVIRVRARAPENA